MTLKEQLIRDEGTRLKPYTDTTGHLTIGFGRNLSQVGISLAEAEYLPAGNTSLLAVSNNAAIYL